MALLSALEQHGRDLEDEARDESHPIVTARYDPARTATDTTDAEHAHTPMLRRSCESSTATAGAAPVARLRSRSLVATRRHSEITGIRRTSRCASRLDRYCRQYPELTPIVKRGNR